jgi:hypothetical protein
MCVCVCACVREMQGECRVLRVEGYHNIYYSGRKSQTTTTNISVIRKPRYASHIRVGCCAEPHALAGL